MPIIDDRTTALNLPLPHVENNIEDDVARLRTALTGLDTDAGAKATAINGKAASVHGHAMSDITGLVSALADKAAASHVHTFASLTGVDVSGAANGMYLRRIAGVWQGVTITITELPDVKDYIDAGLLTVSNAAAAAASNANGRVSKSGDTMTGALVLSGAPTLDLHAASKNYVDQRGLPGQFYGLTLSNNTGTPSTHIDIAVGAATDPTSFALMRLASAMTKNMGASFAAGSGNGGWLDGGAMPDGPGHVFLIGRSDTGAVDVGASGSFNPTLTAPWDRKFYIGPILRKSGAILGFKHIGNHIIWNAPADDDNTASPGTSARTVSLTVPTGGKVLAKVRFSLNSNTNANIFGRVSDLAVADVTPDVINSQLVYTSNSSTFLTAFATVDVITNTSGQIRSRLDTNVATRIVTLGFEIIR